MGGDGARRFVLALCFRGFPGGWLRHTVFTRRQPITWPRSRTITALAGRLESPSLKERRICPLTITECGMRHAERGVRNGEGRSWRVGASNVLDPHWKTMHRTAAMGVALRQSSGQALAAACAQDSTPLDDQHALRPRPRCGWSCGHSRGPFANVEGSWRELRPPTCGRTLGP